MHELLYSLERYPALWIQPAVVFLVTLGIAYLIRRIFFGALHRWSARSSTRAVTALQDALRGPTHIWNFILAIHFAIQSSSLPHRFTERAPEVLQVLFIASLTLMFMRVAGDMVRNFGDQIPGAVPVTTLSQNLAQLAVLILGILVGLRVIGIEVTPILTALGVGGLAVALALQDTLSNLFAGFYISVARQIRPGDYIKLSSGEEGYVTDISWRATAMRKLNEQYGDRAELEAGAVECDELLSAGKAHGRVRAGGCGLRFGYRTSGARVARNRNEGRRGSPRNGADPAPAVTLDPGFGDSSLGFTLAFRWRNSRSSTSFGTKSASAF